MIIELRLYEIRPQNMAQWLELWERAALPVLKEICGGFLGMYVTEVGHINEFIHMWRFEDSGERERRRAHLAEDERWKAYLRELAALGAIQNARVRIVRPTAFSPQLEAEPATKPPGASLATTMQRG